ncbi:MULTISPECIES: DoxX family membrane protein [unclassified Tenacibaculum]|uniref:DoxX family membrane protein n=1 Tax=unclassified Tenacibaculum TaxID=2635139 RepID=UPI001F3D641B|nr:MULTISPECIES: DoxX family membrane protein [unclassified Tenacibaculum]MCF2873946.1 DoxX family protein [Tenacibaculum sp. Cn5-1]MCF2934527.1 DoxX family protein [Tenacibaculum sp. Cn5-34]MCG7510737.1 DoxX family protein [Tenacibaculum sp. Cn5-46]
MKKYLPLILKLIAAIIMLQTLFFKFSGAQESIDLFTKLAGENEASMRIGTGVLELIASILLFIPKRTWLGAILTVGLMGGAIMGHLTKLGIEHNNDGGALFICAVITLIAGIILLIINRKDIPFIGNKL